MKESELFVSPDVLRLNPSLGLNKKIEPINEPVVRKTLFAESEADFSSWFEDYLHVRGYKFAHFRPARVMRNGKETYETPVSGDAKGLPDYHCWSWTGFYFWAELKSETGKLSGAQFDCIDSLRRAGETVFVWRPHDRDEIRRVLK